jgi:hypothetical protein
MSSEDSIDDDVDYGNVPEYFCETLARIHQVGSCRRLVLAIHETVGGRRSRVAVVRLVFPAEALTEMAQKLAADIHGPKPSTGRSAITLVN